jgi:DNA-binding MarR family transcriptional regulator
VRERQKSNVPPHSASALVSMSRALVRPSQSDDPKGEFPLDLTAYVFHLFAVIGRHREAKIDERLRPLGLNLSRHRALSVIARLEPCTMSELAEFSAVDRTTMTRTVDQLVESGLVERATPPEDRRQVKLTLTDPGRDRCEASLKAIYELSLTLLEGLPEEAQRQFARTLEALLGNLLDDPGLVDRLTLRAADSEGPRLSS